MKQNTGLQVRVRRSKLSDVPVQVNVGRDRHGKDTNNTKDTKEIRVGDKVKVSDFESLGTIVKVKFGGSFAMVLLNGINQYFPITDISKVM